jgi:hypothetical protein
MTWLGYYLYMKKLNKHPYMVAGEIPYEKVSEFYTWKLQYQIIYGDYKFRHIPATILHRIKSKYHGWLFRLDYYEKDGKIYNHQTDKPFYIHDQKGMYMYCHKPCRPDCKYCKQTICTYRRYVLDKKTWGRGWFKKLKKKEGEVCSKQ